ncbi:glycosyltransferase [Vibrio breoganii]|uniref:glycosyltransferase n=1 Tax=Vibrio breoganii TaxID=553239 RepID=UPI0002FC793E|nr:glycosyltransferase [Vibrio breoganii]OED96259.1 glycosyltransferase [Vibrio breoganii ZF-29]OEF86006.1 glycosyltransferase [Vibrio breoganii 1C10]
MNKKKNLAFVLPDLRGGGAEKVIVGLANFFANSMQVYIFVGSASGPRFAEVSERVKVVVIGKTSGLKAAIKIRKLCDEYQIDIVLGTLGMAHGVAISKILGNRSLCVSRLGNTVSEDLKRWSGPSRFLRKIYQYVLLASDVVVTQSNYMHKDLYEILPLFRYKKRIIQIYNPVCIDDINKKAEEFDASSIGENDFISIGRLDLQKDVITTLKAFKIYSSKNPDVKLHLIGEGSERIRLEDYVIENNLTSCVLFHGYVDNPYPYIKQAHAFVMSSIYEGFSNAVLEAVSMGKLVIVSDCPGGNRELVEDGVNGMLFEVGNYFTMAQKLEESQQFKIKTCDTSKFAISAIAKEYSNIFKVYS